LSGYVRDESLDGRTYRGVSVCRSGGRLGPERRLPAAGRWRGERAGAGGGRD